MELIERYLHQVGRYLPRKNREDILGEMRSTLADALEDQAGDNPTEADVIAMLKTYGAPHTMAAKYYPEGQYLVGPTLYPLFRMVTGIALAAVLGAQVIAWLVAALFAGQPISAVDAAAGMVNSLPTTIGWIVIVFIILQRLDVHPDMDDEKSWDPTTLPPIDKTKEVSRAELVASIIIQSIILALLAMFPDKIGVYIFPGGAFFGNPVLVAYLPWISLALLLGIGLNVYLLWQGQWTLTSQVVKVASNIFGIVILGLLVQAHYAWLQARDAGTFITSIEMFAKDIESGGQIFSMQIFFMAFTVALVVTLIETAVTLFRLAQKNLLK